MTEGASDEQEPTTPEPPNRVLAVVLDSPLAGIAPWIVMSLFSGPGRFEVSVLAALALSLLFFVLGRRRGSSVKLMEVFDLIFFVGFAIIGILASAATIAWLELWAGEITNIALTVFVVVTIIIRRPFTLGYAKETAEPWLWDNPVFLRINYEISLVWAAVFGFQSIVGLYGDAVQHNSDNFWTGWTLQLAATVFGVAFTEFWPEYASSKAQGEPLPSKRPLLEWIPVFFIITGVAGLLTDSLGTLIAIVIIVVGAIAEVALVRAQKAEAARGGGRAATGGGAVGGGGAAGGAVGGDASRE